MVGLIWGHDTPLSFMLHGCLSTTCSWGSGNGKGSRNECSLKVLCMLESHTGLFKFATSLWWKTAMRLLPRHFLGMTALLHPESGHYDKDPCRFPTSSCFPWSCFRITSLELILWKVSYRHPNTLERKRCLLAGPCSSSPAHSRRLEQRVALPAPAPLHNPHPHWGL